MSILIRPIHSLDEYERLEELQRVVWEMPDNTEVVPIHMLLTAAHNGGVLLGAFEAETGQMVGFVFSFLGLSETGQLKHCSHMAAVLPGRQNSQIGTLLKLAQREAVLKQGLTLITWTFDPLQSRNAYFNFHKLGGISCTYHRNLYGEMRDELNAGMPSDRLLLEWHLASEHVKDCLSGLARRETPAGRANPCILRGDSRSGLLRPGASLPAYDEAALLIQMPANFPEIKQLDRRLALDWQEHTRTVLESAFQTGYTATDYLRQGEECYYYLEKDWHLA